METRHLIDAIVQQTTLLIAQLATSAGIRAPLAHIADQVFLDLAREIEQQGVTRKVVADMFGMALRTYQKKVNRLRASVTRREQTLWAERARVRARARRRDAASRCSPRSRRTTSGTWSRCSATWSRAACSMPPGAGNTPPTARRRADDQQALFEEQSLETLLHLVWLEIADWPGVHARSAARALRATARAR